MLRYGIAAHKLTHGSLEEQSVTASPHAIVNRQGKTPSSTSTMSNLSFATLVPCHLVHRRALAEVLLTDWRPVGDNRYRLAAQWSRSHSLYRVRDGRHDPLLLAETLRQGALLLSFAELGVPSDAKLVMDRMVWHMSPLGVLAGTAPANIVGHARLTETRRRTARLAAIRLDVDFVLETVGQVGSATGWARCLAPNVYDRLRHGAEPSDCVTLEVPPPVESAAVGVCHDDDVVLTAPVIENEWPLRVLTDHGVLFDHPVDHVPGMLMLEGMRQAGRLCWGWPDAQIVDCDVEFMRFVELDTPASVRTRLLRTDPGYATVEAQVRQSGATAATAVMTMRTASSARRHGPDGCAA